MIEIEDALEREAESGERVTRVLIVAPYASVRAGLHALLAETGDCAVVGEIGGSVELTRLLPELRPDVVLCDDNAGEGARLAGLLAEGEVGLVVLGEALDDSALLAASSLPGWAYLLKEAGGLEIAGAVRAVHRGLIVLDRALSPLLIGAFARAENAATAATLEADDLPGAAPTPREREVLQLMAQGLPNKIIAVRLGISQHTVKFHVAAILAKLGASSRTEAVTLGARRGYVSL